jgi:hypothetical protein
VFGGQGGSSGNEEENDWRGWGEGGDGGEGAHNLPGVADNLSGGAPSSPSWGKEAGGAEVEHTP